MTTAAQQFAARQAGQPIPALAARDTKTVAPVAKTYVHQVAGANTILPDGTRLNFYGKVGSASRGTSSGFGYYTTDIESEIEWLDSLAKAAGSQVTFLVEDPQTHQETMVYKREDPAIAEARADAMKNSERMMNPAVASVVDNMAKTIAATSGQ